MSVVHAKGGDPRAAAAHGPRWRRGVGISVLAAGVVVTQVTALVAEPNPPDATAAALRLPGLLEARVFASEPMISNPTNIAVDARGRVWVCDVVNYRHNQGKRPEGDRILILEDVDGDGAADKSTVFYQGPEVDSALGICLLEDRVLVSCAPYVWMFFDDDGDDRADRKEPLFANAGLPQHDHAAHAFVFGPDGKLYWNVGNENRGIGDAQGNLLRDPWGREILNQGRPFRQGMAFRCNLDGTGMEVIAHNLRNSYELTVDPFGSVWFSDNDDDGNQGTRIAYALEGGNYGYTDEMTGQYWGAPRIGMHPDIPRRHWHQNDPGVVPNLLHTGSGSPAGIEMYEGDLLGEDYVGALIHCEPGHNEVRAFMPRAVGSGLDVEQTTLIDGKGDSWFRPVDVAAAPDGSLMIADWYDPGVGGHHQADVDRGRIYRVAPRGKPYRSESLDDDAPEAWTARLASANHDVRRRAWQRLRAQGEAALPALRQLFKSPIPERRAQALWLLTLLPAAAEETLQAASDDMDQRVQIAALRASRSLGDAALKQQLRQAVNDPSQQVRREAAVALRWLDVDDPLRPWLWGQLAARYEAGDRWMLEALGLAADDDWEACLEAWLGMAGRDAWERPAGRDLVWRARGASALDYQAKLLLDEATADAELPRLLRALDFSRTDDKSRRLVDLAQAAADLAPPRRGLIMSEALSRLEGEPTAASRALVEQLLAAGEAGQRALEFVMKFRIDDRYADLLQEALRNSTSMDDAVRTVQFLLREQQWDLLRAPLQQAEGPRGRMIELLAASGGRPAVEFLLPTALDLKQEPTLRQEAIRAIAANREGAERLVDLAEQRILDQEGRTALALALRLTPFQDLAERTAADAPELPAAENETFAIEQWMRMAGNAEHGRQLFFGKATCSTCHRVGDQGQDVGPALTEIGSKLSRTGLFESVLYPSAAISHNYETYLALTADGTAVSGVLRGEDAEGVTLRNDKGVDLELPKSELTSLEKQTISLMPAGLHRLLAPHELADLIAYLATLRKGE